MEIDCGMVGGTPQEWVEQAWIWNSPETIYKICKRTSQKSEAKNYNYILMAPFLYIF